VELVSYNEELHNLHSSPHIIRVLEMNEDEMGRAPSMYEEYEKRIENFNRKCRKEE
jgi:hypothetical protein